MKALLLVLAMAMTASSPFASHTLCSGIMPENDLFIPMSFNTGLTEAQFNDALDRIQVLYSPIVRERGGRLQIERLWEDDTVNASASQWGSTYYLNMYGGLARHPMISYDAFVMVGCHEMGHHIGGAPKFSRNGWATIEGQADYYAALKCMRQVYTDNENAEYLNRPNIDPYVLQECGKQFTNNSDIGACARSAMAAMDLVNLFRSVKNDSRPVAFNTPDPKQVRRMYQDHPDTQCRLDTYFAGAKCSRSTSENVSDSDPQPGTCTRSAKDAEGLRPLCWYLP